MFEKVFARFFVKVAKKNGATVISAKREIKEIGAELKNATTADAVIADNAFWERRGKTYGALFLSLNGRAL